MPFCGKCGIEFPEEFQFCPECGTARVTTRKSKSHSPTKDQPTPLPEDFGQTIQRDGRVYGVVNLEKLPAGHIIDERYVIKEKLGQGGFGAVYRAFDQKMNVDKALKIIPEAVSNDLRAMTNLRQEAQTMIRLNHNNLVRMYDFQESGAVKYIDMEYIDGKSLNELLLDFPDQKMPEEKVKKIALQISEGLIYAHKQNVIHRDIKPQNIMLSRDGQIKIMDFGIAETLRNSMSMIQNSGTTGTLMYMSPEQLMGGEVRKTSDIYSF
ncbi:protein kinase, partial [bacterium]|nr:protein kinase [bacterium]